MKRIVLIICIAALLFAGFTIPAGGFADDEHPITLTVVCDPVPEMEEGGTVPDLLFTIRNNSKSDYTLTNAVLSEGYENIPLKLDEADDPITVLASGTKEFHLSDVPVADDQLDVEVVYRLSWDETRVTVDEETGEVRSEVFHRETSASILIERFVVPVLTVTAQCDSALVRAEDRFTVTYTIRNDTKFDVTGLRLYDPEQSLQSIPLPNTELVAGQKLVVPVEYEMGTTDMTFCPTVEYVGRQRNLTAAAEKTLSVGSLIVDLSISTEANPATADGTEFFITVKNNGNQTMTDVMVYDEIHTLIESAFDLPPQQTRVLRYTVKAAVSSDVIRTVRFHLTARDALKKLTTVEDAASFQVTPYIDEGGLRIELRVEPQKPFYDEQNKLCVSFQFNIRTYGDVKFRNAVLSEQTLFGTVVSYEELLHGESYYYTQTYQIDGVDSLIFFVTAYDPAGQKHASQSVAVDLVALREQADAKIDPVYVYTTNPYMQDLDAKYREVLKVITVVALCVAAFCAIVCIILYAVEMRIRSKLPAAFEEDMEKALLATKRRMDDPLFTDAPTERFGYRAPIKLRSYGELTEEEAKARRELYARGLEESLKKEGTAPRPKPAAPKTAVRVEKDGTQVLSAPKAAPYSDEAYRRPTSEPEKPVTTRPTDTAITRKPTPESAKPVTARPTDTAITRKPATESLKPVTTRPTDSVVARKPATESAKSVTTRPTDTVITRKPAPESAKPVTTRPTDTAITRKPATESLKSVTTRPTDTVITRKPAPESARADETAAFRRTVAARPMETTSVRKPAPETPKPVITRATEPVAEHAESELAVRKTVLRRPKPEAPRVREESAPIAVHTAADGVTRIIMPRPKPEAVAAAAAATEGAALLRRSANLRTSEETTFIHRVPTSFDESETIPKSETIIPDVPPTSETTAPDVPPIPETANSVGDVVPDVPPTSETTAPDVPPIPETANSVGDVVPDVPSTSETTALDVPPTPEKTNPDVPPTPEKTNLDVPPTPEKEPVAQDNYALAPEEKPAEDSHPKAFSFEEKVSRLAETDEVSPVSTERQTHEETTETSDETAALPVHSELSSSVPETAPFVFPIPTFLRKAADAPEETPTDLPPDHVECPVGDVVPDVPPTSETTDSVGDVVPDVPSTPETANPDVPPTPVTANPIGDVVLDVPPTPETANPDVSPTPETTNSVGDVVLDVPSTPEKEPAAQDNYALAPEEKPAEDSHPKAFSFEEKVSRLAETDEVSPVSTERQTLEETTETSDETAALPVPSKLFSSVPETAPIVFPIPTFLRKAADAPEETPTDLPPDPVECPVGDVVPDVPPTPVTANPVGDVVLDVPPTPETTDSVGDVVPDVPPLSEPDPAEQAEIPLFRRYAEKPTPKKRPAEYLTVKYMNR